MQVTEAIGKTITNIYSLVKMEVGGLDTGECFIELDNTILIDIPYSFDSNIAQEALDKEAISLFADLSDYPVYYINKENKTFGEIASQYQREKRTFFNRLRKLLFGQAPVNKATIPYKVEYRENKLKYLKDRRIIDFIWYPDEIEKGFYLLDNGYLITETTIAPHGTGLAGLNLYESINDMMNSKGDDYSRLSGKSN